ncbi:MAG TPA: glycosyltransferase [Pyrinomonadaceae bacterium]|nr:glycosyltransferase [Pyrinomonadaceae bacterium]
MKARRILVLTLSFGSGHVTAARAVAEELRRRDPSADVRVVDALEGARLAFRACYAWPYWLMIRHAPKLWERFFESRVARGDEGTAPAWAFRWGCAHVFKLVAEFRPDAIVACEVAACELASLARREGLTSARVVAVITDHEAEPVWVKPETDAFVVADERVREQLRSWGARVEAIAVCGIPTDAAFGARYDAEEMRRRHGIGGDAPVVLLMCGGMGPARTDVVARHLCASGERVNVVAVAGRDEKMRRRLSRIKAEPPSTLRVVGWTDDVAALMQAASLLVTKPGGLTTAEAALSSLPVVFFDAIPGPERRNAARVADAGAGLLADSPEEAARAALALLRDETARRRMAARAFELSSADAAATVARIALDGDMVVETAGESAFARPAAERMTA